MRRLAALPALAPGAVWAHAGERMVILTLPTGPAIAAAAAVVALTAVIGAMAGRLPRVGVVTLVEKRALLPVWLTSWIACVALFGLVAVGFWGSRDPLGNLLPLTVWTLMWVGLTLACIVFGNLWRAINPWTGPVATVRRLLGRTGSVGLARLGYLPAVVGFLAFAWFEIVSLAPDDPEVLARAVLGYWLVVFVLGVLEGEDWLERGEAFTVFYGFVARIAPFWREFAAGRVRFRAGLPGAQILDMPPLPPTAIAFVTLVLASVTFDGLAETFWWLGLIGVNPLEFPGRSAVMAVNTAGLLATWAAAAGSILATIAAGRWLAGAGGRSWRETGPFMLSFLPIAAGYHVAHYFLSLLTTGQYAVEALNDPFGRGWSLFGLPHHWVSFGFVNDPAVVWTIWNVQWVAIVGAHVMAVILSLKITARAAARPALAHLPMTVLMVLYTMLGLWLLATPVAG